MVQAFRRPHSPAVSMRFKLRGLDPQARYRVTDLDRQKAQEISGTQLGAEGLLISLPQPRSAAVIVYNKQ